MYEYKRLKYCNKDEHRVVWEEEFGEIPAGYVIHHINGVKKDNRIENLELKSRARHTSEHFKGIPKIDILGEEKFRLLSMKLKTARISQRKIKDEFTSFCFCCKNFYQLNVLVKMQEDLMD